MNRPTQPVLKDFYCTAAILFLTVKIQPQAAITLHPTGYTWHHLRDYDPAINEATMQLVESGAHVKSCPHSGSVNQFESHHGTKYGSREAKNITSKINRILSES